MRELHLTKKDFTIEWFSGQGAGGQHRNKHQNCCRITHKASGLSCVGQNSRSRVSNQREAFNRLARLVISQINMPEEKIISNERIRTYNEKTNLVYDHASGEKRTYKSVINGNGLRELI